MYKGLMWKRVGSYVAEGRRGYGAAELSDGLRKIERIVLSGY